MEYAHLILFSAASFIARSKFSSGKSSLSKTAHASIYGSPSFSALSRSSIALLTTKIVLFPIPFTSTASKTSGCSGNFLKYAGSVFSPSQTIRIFLRLRFFLEVLTKSTLNCALLSIQKK